MKWYERFAQKYRNFGISNLSTYISVSMLIIFVAQRILGLPIVEAFSLNIPMVLRGQVWRLVTFALIPETGSFFWIIFLVYTYYSIGKQMEEYWGKAVFTLYYLIGMLGTIVGAFFVGGGSNTYLNMSLFLAFAYLYPNATFMIYFFIPVKAKYLAYFETAIYVFQLGQGGYNGIKFGNWTTVVMLLASLINFIVFFLPDIINNIKRKMKNRKRKKEYERNLRGGGQ